MKKVVGILILAIVLMLAGCGEEPIDQVHSVKIEMIEIHIVPDYTYFPESMQRPSVKGCASYGNEIWILGFKVDNKVHVDWEVLGHEIQHLMSHYDANVGNPDELM